MENEKELLEGITKVLEMKANVKGMNEDGLKKVKQITELAQELTNLAPSVEIAEIGEICSDNEVWKLTISIRTDEIKAVPISEGLTEHSPLSVFRELVNASDKLMFSVEGKRTLISFYSLDLWDIDFE